MAPPRFWRSKSQRSIATAATQASSAEEEREGRDGSFDPSMAHPSSSVTSSSVTVRPEQTATTRDEAPPTTVPSARASQRFSPASSFYMIALTFSILGAQIVWSLELSHGTLYLLSLGLSPRSTSLVWLAGPISGLVAQPLIGHLSDESTNRYWRRRGYMLGSCLLIVTTTLILAYAASVAEGIVDFFGIGLADWDPVRLDQVYSMMQFIAITAFWLLEFALNGLAASSRALILDKLPAESIVLGNAWQGRMTHIGNVIGYMAGWLNLSKLTILQPLEGGQFRKYAFISQIGVIASVVTTCLLISEGEEVTDDVRHISSTQASTFSSASVKHQYDAHRRTWLRSLRSSLRSIWYVLLRLPRPVRRVCLVQFFSFLAWFPQLFYSSTYVGSFEPRGTSPQLRESRERKGTEGLLVFAIISLIAGTLLPLMYLSRQNQSCGQGLNRRRLQFLARLGQTVANCPGRGSPGFFLRTLWTASCLMHSVLFLFGTFFVSNTTQAIWLIALSGVPWSIACWVPYSLLMSFVQEAESGHSPYEFPGDFWDPETRARQQARRYSQERGALQGSAADSGTANLRSALEDCKPLSSKARRQSRTEGKGSFLVRGNEIIGNGRRQRSPGGKSPRDPASSGIVESMQRVTSSSIRRSSAHQGSEQSDDDEGEGAEHDPLLPAIRDEAGGVSASGQSQSDEELEMGATSGKRGTILGLHNLFIVIPQLVVSLIASIIFSIFDKEDDVDDTSNGRGSREHQNTSDGSAPGVVWVLRFGGACMLAAAASTRLLPLIEAERRSLRQVS